MTQISAPILGVVVDRIGPKRSAYLQAILATTSLSLVVLASISKIDALLNVGFVMLALHTWLATLVIVPLGLYFQGHTTSRIIFVLNTFFDAGTLTYLGLWGIEQAFDNITTPIVLSGYLVLGVVVYGTASYFWMVAVPEPEECDQSIAGDVVEEECNEPIVEREEVKPEASSMDDSADLDGSHSHIMNESSGSFDRVVSTEEKTPAPPRQLVSLPFGLLCVFFGLQVGTSNWNTATQRDFLAGLGDDEYNHLYLTIFTLLTPVSILGTPIIDWVVLRSEWTTALQIVNFLSIAFQVVKVSTDNLNAQILGFLLFSFYRCFLFGLTYSFLSCLVDGPLVGRAAGIMTGFAGIVNISMIPFVNLAVHQGNGDFWTANVIVLCLAFPSTVFW